MILGSSLENRLPVEALASMFIAWKKVLHASCFQSKKNEQHTDFPSGHPPEYYLRLTLLNFTDRTGCGETT